MFARTLLVLGFGNPGWVLPAREPSTTNHLVQGPHSRRFSGDERRNRSFLGQSGLPCEFLGWKLCSMTRIGLDLLPLILRGELSLGASKSLNFPILGISPHSWRFEGIAGHIISRTRLAVVFRHLGLEYLPDNEP